MTAAAALLALGPLHPRSHELVFGVPGSGKTHHARERMAAVRRAVFFDVTGHDYQDDGERVDVEDLERTELWLAPFVRLVVTPGDADVAGDFTRTVAACRAIGRRVPLALLGDEVGDYSKACGEVLTRLHRNGHHDGLVSILVSQCAVDVPLTCRRTATRVTSLLQVADVDLEAIESQYGRDFAERVRSWRPGDAPAVWTLPTLHHPHDR